ncbi:hypothetical protein [Mesorhizobium sp.]|uniref:hypothetical protein n=1 Tax=Mesorhizobium sp. TaxID=1871066 RepID=UPI0012184D8B|nr:hypothetical protein [Mesorhizobium sp.]TIX28817.1 MAG: hypothetical protein E5V35_00215 [Mesorhizobium sp.]
MLSNLLLYRITVFNACILAGLVWAFLQGRVQVLFANETTGIGYGMVVVFLVAMVGFAQRVIKTTAALNEVKAGKWVDARKFKIKNSFVAAVSVWLVTLGLIGNITGFSQAVEGLNLSGGPDAAMHAISEMIDGMKVAFYTTLIGTGLGLWLAVNGHILRTATALLHIDADALKGGVYVK